LFKGATGTQITKPLINTLPDIYAIGASASPAQPDSTSPLWFVWVAGIVAFALFFLVTLLRCLREYKAALPVENDYINEWVVFPLTCNNINSLAILFSYSHI
jgi:hypothetical protein